ncbi:glyoxylase-like metal-dependent hydrolase (beta-lactamase superfamily II) [Herbihabitans rhizosphaerae]|uniref:Glyoxylase-like metal-dependent hydrolase (Beta-lactamase superfamily II) n=1 Tax=Herbihabitans rhizosphaerae TaxID=1872711 RepID=A0A4Q7KFQ4_9PSEU|nr:MBL fold metallo-hydrolase [Herbihabitans rhizosphaerae]RZS32733.1 glyoxylase-like metal-dependent hydrolase (beta-lactamase superfamily II) [Herbihabitans rhizosphaerae]
MADWTEPGVFEVAPGVHRIPLPLPNDGLRAVNVYAIADGDGVVLIDSGWALDEARDALESALGSIGYEFTDVRRFLVTHMHRDHYTMAVSLRRMFGTKVALGAGEQPSMEWVMRDRLDRMFADVRRWGALHLAEQLQAAHDPSSEETARRDYEDPDEWIIGRASIDLDHRELLALPTPGHTQGHLVFLDSAEGVMFTGDHVLPHITPSIGFEPVRAELPLGDYLDSLRLVRTYPDMRMLPAHGEIAPSVHSRVDELLAHHDDRLAATTAAVRAGTGTAFETARALPWTRRHRKFDELNLFNAMLAVGETSAHLDLLVARGELESSTVDGVKQYALAVFDSAERD